MLEAKILRCFKGQDKSTLSKNDAEALIMDFNFKFCLA